MAQYLDRDGLVVLKEELSKAFSQVEDNASSRMWNIVTNHAAPKEHYHDKILSEKHTITDLNTVDLIDVENSSMGYLKCGWINKENTVGAPNDSSFKSGGEVLSFFTGRGHGLQIVGEYKNRGIYTRNRNADDKTWTSWKRLAFADEIPIIPTITDEKVKANTSTGKVYLVGQDDATNDTTEIVYKNASVYMQSGKMYATSGNINSSETALVSGATVNAAINTALSSALQYCGTLASDFNVSVAAAKTGKKKGDVYVASATFKPSKTYINNWKDSSVEPGDLFIFDGSKFDIVNGENQVEQISHTLAWDSDVSIAKIDGTTITVKLPSNPNTDYQTTKAGHYTPSDKDSSITLTASGTVSWGGAVVTGLTKDSKGHITGVTTSTIPSNPNTHYQTGITAGASGTITNSSTTNPYIKIKDDSTHRSQIQLKGGGITSVSSDANGAITISTSGDNWVSQTNTISNLNSITNGKGIWGWINAKSTNKPDGSTSGGEGITSGGELLSFTLNNGHCLQIASHYKGNGIYTRNRNADKVNTSEEWSKWKKLAFVEDIPTKLSQFTDDVVADKYLPLTGGTIRNDGNATPLTIASSAQAYTGMSFINKNNERGYFMYAGGSDYGVTAANWSATYTLMHSGNIGNYKSGDSAKLDGLSKSDFVRSYGDVGANYSKGNWAGYSYATEAHGGSTAGGVISAGNEKWGFQLNGGAFNDGVYYRAYSDGTFNSWRKLAFTSDIPTKLSQFTDDVVAGKYLPLSGGTVVGEFAIKAGAANSATIRFSPNSGAINHWLGVNSAGVLWFTNNGWSQQYDILHSGNIGNYEAGSSVWSKGLDRITSIPASGHCVYFYSGQPTLGDDINNAKEGSNAYHLWSYPVNGTSVAGGTANIMNLRLQWNTAYLHDIFVSPNSDDIWHRSIINEICNPWRKFAFTDSNVASATKLQTPRTLWGQSFDGTADVSGDITAPKIVVKGSNHSATMEMNGSSLKIDKELMLTAGGTADICSGIACALKADRLQIKNLISENIILGSSNNGTQSNMSFNVQKYGSISNTAPASLTTLLTVNTTGNVGIGTTSPSEKLDVAGNVKASAFCKTGSSDSYVLLGGGGHKSLSDFSKASWNTFTPAETALTNDDVLSTTGEFSLSKGSWYYAGNGYLPAGEFGNIDLAGCSVLTFGGNSGGAYTQLFITSPAPMGSNTVKANEILFYNNHGSGYNPGWTRVLTNRNYTDYITDTNYYHTSSYSSGLQISTGTGVSNMYVPYATATQAGVISTGSQTFAGDKTFSTVTASAFYEGSDERLKTFGEDIKVDFDELVKLRKSHFVFNNNPTKQEIGVSAQEVQKIYPEIVNTNEDGYLSVDYAKLSVIALKAVDILYNQNKDFERRLKEIEDKLK